MTKHMDQRGHDNSSITHDDDLRRERILRKEDDSWRSYTPHVHIYVRTWFYLAGERIERFGVDGFLFCISALSLLDERDRGRPGCDLMCDDYLADIFDLLTPA